MSGLEIERKFLVKKGDAYKSAAFSDSHIQQGYIPAHGATVRVRTRDDKAYLTIKGKSVNSVESCTNNNSDSKVKDICLEQKLFEFFNHRKTS